MRVNVLILILIITSISFSQTPLDYFPHESGNIWKYFAHSEGIGAQMIQSTIVFDSTDSMGNIFLTIENRCLEQGGAPPAYSNLYPSCNYIIIDSNYVFSEHENIPTYGNINGYYLKYKLDADSGETWIVDSDSI